MTVCKRFVGEREDEEYSIYGSNRLTVYKTETALKRILDFFKIDVDNPLISMTHPQIQAAIESPNGKGLYEMFSHATGRSKVDYRRQINTIRAKFSELTNCKSLIFDHNTKTLEITPNDGNQMADSFTLMLILWHCFESPVKFADDIDLLNFEDTNEHEQLSQLIEPSNENCQDASQLFVISQQRIFSPQFCKFNQALIIQLCTSSRSSGKESRRRCGAAIEA